MQPDQALKIGAKSPILQAKQQTGRRCAPPEHAEKTDAGW
jgi:hypothetical protein